MPLSFGSAATRRLHVWPIHAFVRTHLLVLMLFEADTYGYRLVMPMYAPMVAVAAQVPLVAFALVVLGVTRRLGRPSQRDGRTRDALRGPGLVDARRCGRWCGKRRGWSRSGRSVRHRCTAWADRRPWRRRRPTCVGADTIYVASIDGTPRRFGVGEPARAALPVVQVVRPVTLGAAAANRRARPSTCSPSSMGTPSPAT